MHHRFLILHFHKTWNKMLERLFLFIVIILRIILVDVVIDLLRLPSMKAPVPRLGMQSTLHCCRKSYTILSSLAPGMHLQVRIKSCLLSSSVKVEHSSIGNIYQDGHDCSGHFKYPAVFNSWPNSTRKTQRSFNINTSINFFRSFWFQMELWLFFVICLTNDLMALRLFFCTLLQRFACIYALV